MRDVGAATGTDLTVAVLDGVTSSGLVGMPAALPTGWSVTGGQLVGPAPNLT